MHIQAQDDCRPCDRPAEHRDPDDGASCPITDTEEYVAFVARHARDLDRLAFLLVGNKHTTEDLTAEVFLAIWRRWDRVSSADRPLAYVRQMLINQAAGHHRRTARERHRLDRLSLFSTAGVGTEGPDSAAVVDVRAALLRLPPRRRACLVLRYAFDLSEQEVAETLAISVGTVKSQTSKAATQFRREIGDGSTTLSSLEHPAPETTALRESDRAS